MRRLAAALLLALAACSSETPTEPARGPFLVLSYSGPCGRDDAVVEVDGTAVGRVRIPGSFAWALPAGAHTLRVGTSPAIPVDMPADRDLLLTNVPSPCP